ncbi:MAG: hypothetical protein AAGJ94_18090, partial [Pseudomonadota bacterium]
MTLSHPGSGVSGKAARPTSTRGRLVDVPYPYAQLRRHYWIAIACLLPAALVLVFFASSAHLSEATLTMVNTLFPMYSMVVLAALIYNCVKDLPETIWTAFVWAPMQSIVFLYFGPLINIFGSEATLLARAGHPLTVTPAELLRANLLISVAVPLLLTGMAAALSVLAPPRVPRHVWQDANRFVYPERLASIAFMVILAGGLFRYALVKPAEWQVIPIIVPGIFGSLGFMVDLGLALLAYIAASRKGSRWVIPLIILWGGHVALTLLSFAKTELVVALVFPILGIYLARRRLKELAFGAAMTAVAFSLSTPLVTHGRGELFLIHGDINRGGYNDRINVLTTYVTGSASSNTPSYVIDEERTAQWWWVRLDYASPIAKAMLLHDSGYESRTIETAWMRFIPRVIWPEKPILEGPGTYFYSTLLGRETSTLVGISIYGDMYWHYGWLGVIFIAPLVGFVFGFASRFALKWVLEREFIFFPLVLYMLIWVASGTNKYLINGFIGALPIIVAYTAAFYLFSGVLKGEMANERRKRRPQRTLRGPPQGQGPRPPPRPGARPLGPR